LQRRALAGKNNMQKRVKFNIIVAQTSKRPVLMKNRPFLGIKSGFSPINTGASSS
jgi:hypothetical protein